MRDYGARLESVEDESSLASFVRQLASSAIDVQRTLDHGVDESRAFLLREISDWPEELQSLMIPVVPPRLRAATYSVEALLETRLSRQRVGEIQIRLLNAGYSRMYGIDAERSSLIRLEVQQAPMVEPERNE